MTSNNYQQPFYKMHDHEGNRRNKHLALGVLVILIGLTLLGKRIGLFFVHLHFWPLLLIGMGVYHGVKHKFTRLTSWAMIALGVAFLIPKFFIWGVLSTHLFAPIALILFGTYLIAKPNRSFAFRATKKAGFAKPQTVEFMGNDTFNVSANFSEKTITVDTKSFKQGEVFGNFGKVVLNMLDADIADTATLSINTSFSEVEIVVPASWDVQLKPEYNFSTIEDRRWVSSQPAENAKKLIINGSNNFSKVIIKSR